MPTGQAAETPSIPDAKPLTKLQEGFSYHYARLWKAAPAYRAAGGSEKGAKQNGLNMLKDERILAAIKREATLLGMSVEESTARMSEWGRVTIDDVLTKETVEYRPRIQKALQLAIDDLQQEIILEEWALKRAEKLLPYQNFRSFKVEWALNQLEREKLLRRYELQLESEPTAKVWVDGPSQAREVVRIDLAKVHELKASHMIKKVTPTKYGTAVELHDAKDAVNTMLKIHGAFAPVKVDHTTNGNDMPGSNIMMPDNGRD